MQRWEWILSNGAQIAAELDSGTGRETVRQISRTDAGSTVLSEGTAKKTHEVDAAPVDTDAEAVHATITFDPRGPFCILTVDGFEVAPRVWPQRSRAAPPPPAPARRTWAVVALALTLACGAILFAIARRDAKPSKPLAQSYRADSGLFIAHYPEGTTAKRADLPAALDGVVLTDLMARETIVVAALRLDESAPGDAWALQQRYHDELVALVPKQGGGAYHERERKDAPCIGHAGAVVVGQVEAQTVWSCATSFDGRGYVALAAAPEVDLARLRTVVEATELTNLAAK